VDNKKGAGNTATPLRKKKKGGSFMFQAHNTYRQKKIKIFTSIQNITGELFFLGLSMGLKAEVHAYYFQLTDNFI
jgi:hypothetical protein